MRQQVSPVKSDLCRRFAGHQRSTAAATTERVTGRRRKHGDELQDPVVTRESGITTIAFNRPEKRNAMSPQLHNEMFELLTELRYNSAGTVGIPGRA